MTAPSASRSKPRAAPAVAAPWLGALVRWAEPYEAAEPLAGSFRAKQLHAVLQFTPLTMLANLVSATLICVTFRDRVALALLMVWFLFILLAATWGARQWLAQRRGLARGQVSPRAMRRLVWHACAVALLWGGAVVALSRGADDAERVVLALVACAIMGSGAFALATVPRAAVAFVLVMTGAAAASIALAAPEHAPAICAILAIYGCIAAAGVVSMARSFGARLMAEAEAERQNQLIGMLLRDFEEHANDVLWEIDADGRFCRNSARLLAELCLESGPLREEPAIAILARLHAPDPAAQGCGLTTLREHVEHGLAFRDLLLPLQVRGARRWWSLAAKPLADEGGRIVGWRGVASDITDAHLANHRLSWLTHFDPLTGLANRHQFRARLAHLLAAGFSTRPFAVLCLDLDHFKTLNDTLGHAAGDALLQQVASRLSDITRREDMVARLGSDEFAILLRHADSTEEVALMTRRLLEALQQPCDVQGAAVAVRASIGIALAPRDGTEVDQLLSNADLALHAAKALGRGALRFFAPEMADQTQRRTLIEHALRGALARGEFSLVYQPQVHIGGWRITGFEALLRWRHPALGEVSPAEFIPVAEEAGFIGEIGHWVMHTACTQALRWPADLHVSVNVSGVQVLSGTLPAQIQRVLDATGLPAAQLEVEITESVFLQESHATLEMLRAVRALGVRIALDDFGTGYSSLAYLRRFPFHTLKIDRAFVGELGARRDARAIVRTVIALARTLDMATVAEGVEEPAQIEALRRSGCDAVQGYAMARPMPPSAIDAFLAGWAGDRPAAAIDTQIGPDTALAELQ